MSFNDFTIQSYMIFDVFHDFCSLQVLAFIFDEFWNRFWFHFGAPFGAISMFLGNRLFDDLFNPFLFEF